MSRQRLRESAVKWKISLTDESFAQKILKLVEIKAIINKAKFVDLKICEKISNYLKDNYIDDLNYFEKKNKIKIDIIADNKLIIPEYIIDFKNKSKRTIELIEELKKLKDLSLNKVENLKAKERTTIKKNYKKRNYKKKYFKKSK